MTIPLRRRQTGAAVITTVPSSVRGVARSAEHVPQPDVETRRGFAARRGTAGVDARIDAMARCCCGLPIVNDEVYGWLHAAAAEQAASGQPATAVLGLARVPDMAPPAVGRSADQATERCGAAGAGSAPRSSGASRPCRTAEREVTARGDTGCVSGHARPWVEQVGAVARASGVDLPAQRLAIALGKAVVLTGRGQPGAALRESCSPVITFSCAGPRGTAWRSDAAGADGRGVVSCGSTPLVRCWSAVVGW